MAAHRSDDSKGGKDKSRRTSERQDAQKQDKRQTQDGKSEEFVRSVPAVSLATLLQGVNDGLMTLDEDWRYTYVNEAAAAFFRTTPTGILGKVIWEAFPHLRNSRFYKDFLRAATEKTFVRVEDYYEPQRRWYECRCHPTENGLAVFLNDTTGHKKIEEAMLESRQVLEMAIAGSRAGIWRIDLNPEKPGYVPDYAYLSPQLKALVGFESDEFPNSRSAWQERIVSEDRPRLEEAARAHAEGRTQTYEIDFRIRHKDGSLRWLARRGKLYRDEFNRPIRWAGVDTDITDRKNAEEAMRRLKEQAERAAEQARWLARIPEENPNPTLRISNDHVLLYSNPAAERLCDYWSCWLGHKVPPVVQEIISDALAAGTVRNYEIFCGGRTFWLAVAPCPADDYVNIHARDITERKQMEQSLQQANDLLQAQTEELQSANEELQSQQEELLSQTEELRHQERALRTSERLARDRLAEIEAIYNSAHVGLCVFDRELRYIRINERLAEINGIPASEHLGKTVRQIVPDLADAAEKLAEGIFRTGQPILHMELSGTTAAQPGVLRHWIEHWLPLKDDEGRVVGINVVAHEVTEQKRAHEALQQANERLQAQAEELQTQTEELQTQQEELQMQAEELRAQAEELEESERRLRDAEELFHSAIDNIPEALTIYDADLRIEYVNRRGCKISGRLLSDFVGKREEELWPEDVYKHFVPHLKKAARTRRPQTFEMSLTLPNGNSYTQIVTYQPLLDEHGKLKRMLGVTFDITDRKQAEQERQKLAGELADRVAELQAVLDAAPVAVWIAHDPQCRRITGNAYADRIMHVSRGDNVSRSALPDDTAVTYKVLRDGVELEPEQLPAQAAAATGKPVAEAVLDIAFSDGRIVHLLEAAVPLFDAQGRVRGAIAAGVDVTDLKQAEEALRHSEEQYRSLFKNMLDGYAYCKMLFDDEGHPTDFIYLDVNDAFARLTGLEDVTGKKVTEVIPGIRESHPELLETYGRVATTGRPERLVLDFKPLGIWLSIAVYSPRKGYFTAVFDNITERKQAEQKLAEQALLLANVGDAVIGFDPDYRITFWGAAAERTYGYTEAEAVGKSGREILKPVYVGTTREQALAQLQSTGRLEIEFIQQTKTGRELNIESHAILLRDDKGESCGIVAINRDITDRKQAEEALRAANERVRTTLESIQDGFVAVGFDWKYTYVNDAGAKFLKRRADQLVGVAVFEAWPEARGTIFETGLRKAMEDREQTEFEIHYPPLEAWFECRCYPSSDGISIFFTDVTGRKQAEMALRDSEQRLRMALEGGQMGLWERDSDGNYNYWDERLYELLGLDSKTCRAINQTFLSCVDKRDIGALNESIRKSLADGSDLQIEYRLVRSGGETLWVASRGKVIRDASGKAARMLGVMYDVTQRKLIEEQLRRLNDQLEEEVQAQTEELRDTIDRLQDEVVRRVLAEGKLRKSSQMLEGFFQNTITPLAFMDRQFNFVRVNEAYARAEGRSPEFFKGKNHFLLYPHEENRAIFEQVVQTGQPHRAFAKPFQYMNDPVRATYWDWQLTPLQNDRGDVQYLVLNLQDVTQQQAALQELEHRAFQLQKLTLELSQAEDRERRRMAEVLHDGLQQQLAAAKFHLGLLSSRARNDQTMCEITTQLDGMLRDAIEQSRSLSHELCPAVLYQSDLGETFEWLARQVQTKHGLTVHTEVHGRVDSQSESIKAFLFRTGQEILFNAVKHAEVNEARLRLQRKRDQLWLTISDRGRGFDPATLGRTAGFGLLSIRERVGLLGGRMKIRSMPSRGSIFLIAVPDISVTRDAEQTGGRRREPARASRGSDLRPAALGGPLRVLLVDDHKVMREGLAALIGEQKDMEIIGQAGDGSEAVELARELQPDVVIMDVAMPVMPGDEATRRIKAALPQIRVVALSMFAEPGVCEKMLDAGAEIYLPKTGPSEELLAAIRGLDV